MNTVYRSGAKRHRKIRVGTSPPSQDLLEIRGLESMFNRIGMRSRTLDDHTLSTAIDTRTD